MDWAIKIIETSFEAGGRTEIGTEAEAEAESDCLGYRFRLGSMKYIVKSWEVGSDVLSRRLWTIRGRARCLDQHGLGGSSWVEGVRVKLECAEREAEGVGETIGVAAGVIRGVVRVS